MQHIAKAGVSAAKWSTITTVARFGLQLISQVVLARMLGPDIYGVFGMGLVVFNLSYFFATFGFAWSLGQMQDISDEDIRFAFTWQMTVGIVAAIGLYYSANITADYFHEPRVVPIVKWMAAACILNAAAAVSGYLLRRDLKFKQAGLIQFASYAFGYILVGIPTALMGYGINALVAAWMGQSLSIAVLSIACRPHPYKPKLTSPRAREIFRTGIIVFFTNLVNWAANNLDKVIIGRILSAKSMGLYNAGYNLANLPNSLLISALQPVFLAAGSKVQGQHEQQAKAYREILATTWVILFPAFFTLALLSPDIVLLLYGHAWSAAGPVLAVLFLGMPAYVMWGMSTPVLWNMGRSKLEMMLQLPLIPIAAALFFYMTPYGVIYAASIATLLLFARGLIVGGVACRLVKIPAAFVAQSILRGLVFCALILSSVELFNTLQPDSLPIIIRIMMKSLISVAICLIAVTLKPNLMGSNAARLIVRFAPRLAAKLRLVLE